MVKIFEVSSEVNNCSRCLFLYIRVNPATLGPGLKRDMWIIVLVSTGDGSTAARVSPWFNCAALFRHN